MATLNPKFEAFRAARMAFLIKKGNLPLWLKNGKNPTEADLAMVTDEQWDLLQEYIMLRDDPTNYKDPNRRDADCTVVSGKKAVGKSTFVSRNFVDDYFETLEADGKKRRILIYLPNYDENYAKYRQTDAKEIMATALNPTLWTTGIRVFFGKNHRFNILLLTYYFTNGLLVFEEANGWLSTTGAVQKWQMIPFSQMLHSRPTLP